MIALCFLSASASHGESEERLAAAEAEINFLKRVIAEQDRRITALENALEALQTKTVVSAPSRESAGASANGSASVQPWMTSANWDRVQDGMSQRQVSAILGEPTSIKDTGPFRTLFYRGDVEGSGFVSGNVELSDDRVWAVNKPVF